MRGEKTSISFLMHYALSETLKYCQRNLGESKFYVDCFETGTSALNLYKRLNLSQRGFIYLIETPVSGGYKWSKSDVRKDGCIRMYQL